MSDATPKPHIDLVHEKLMDTLDRLSDKVNPMEIKRALAIKEVAGALIDTARVENEYLKITKQDRSTFLALAPGSETITVKGPGNGITSITQHTLRG